MYSLILLMGRIVGIALCLAKPHFTLAHLIRQDTARLTLSFNFIEPAQNAASLRSGLRSSLGSNPTLFATGRFAQ
jgi:hypothetical protein